MKSWISKHKSLLSVVFKVVAALSVIAAVSAVYLLAPWYQIFEYSEELRNVSLFTVAVIGIPFLIWRTVLLRDDTKARTKDTKLNELNHINKTYTDAITQLGAIHPQQQLNMEVRLGGIYALEQLAKNNKNYHPQIMQVLCSYVRTNSPLPAALYDSEWKDKPPTADIQAILHIIGSRNIDFDSFSMKINLEDTYLYGADLSNLRYSIRQDRKTNFQGANFKGTYLRWANMREVNFYYAEFESADLEHAWLCDSDCRGAHFDSAKLAGAQFDNADLHAATFYEAILTHTNFFGAKNLTFDQLRFAEGWETTLRDDNLICEENAQDEI